MRKLIWSAGALFVLTALVWASGDPWKTKPYQQWNDQDLQKIFTDSPWSKKVPVEGTWKPVTALESSGGTLTPAGNAGGPKGVGGSAAPRSADADDDDNANSNVLFNVYWMSSETMRAALARKSVLHSGKDAAEADKYVQASTDEYQLVVQGQDMAPFFHNGEKFFQANSAIECKKTKRKIAPSHVIYNRGPQNAITSAVFFFPKKSNGEDTIDASEKSVEFTCKLGKSTLHAVFEPQKMANQEGQDL